MALSQSAPDSAVYVLPSVIVIGPTEACSDVFSSVCACRSTFRAVFAGSVSMNSSGEPETIGSPEPSAGLTVGRWMPKPILTTAFVEMSTPPVPVTLTRPPMSGRLRLSGTCSGVEIVHSGSAGAPVGAVQRPNDRRKLTVGGVLPEPGVNMIETRFSFSAAGIPNAAAIRSSRSFSNVCRNADGLEAKSLIVEESFVNASTRSAKLLLITGSFSCSDGFD